MSWEEEPFDQEVHDWQEELQGLLEPKPKRSFRKPLLVGLVAAMFLTAVATMAWSAVSSPPAPYWEPADEVVASGPAPADAPDQVQAAIGGYVPDAAAARAPNDENPDPDSLDGKYFKRGCKPQERLDRTWIDSDESGHYFNVQLNLEPDSREACEFVHAIKRAFPDHQVSQVIRSAWYIDEPYKKASVSVWGEEMDDLYWWLSERMSPDGPVVEIMTD